MTSPLGDFLRSIREDTSPSGVGLPAVGDRRVRGLRREEVALLAGTSVDYYTRLEQGRERSPSTQILVALSRALQLSADTREHLYRLAGYLPEPTSDSPAVDAALVDLLDRWHDTPALVLGRGYDVLVANPLGEALFGGFSTGRNLTERLFLDPAARAFYLDWEKAAADTVAGLRLQHGRWPDDERIHAVVERLSTRAPDFARLWATNTVGSKQNQVKRIAHPDVGPVTVHMLVFPSRPDSGQELVVYHAERGSRSAEALALLGSLRAGPPAMRSTD